LLTNVLFFLYPFIFLFMMMLDVLKQFFFFFFIFLKHKNTFPFCRQFTQFSFCENYFCNFSTSNIRSKSFNFAGMGVNETIRELGPHWSRSLSYESKFHTIWVYLCSHCFYGGSKSKNHKNPLQFFILKQINVIVMGVFLLCVV